MEVAQIATRRMIGRIMPTLTEWIECKDLPRERCEKFRQKYASREKRTVPLSPPESQEKPAETRRGIFRSTFIPPTLPGDCLSETLSVMGVTESLGCGCNGRKAQMNAWGIDGCRQNLDTIAGWLREQAGQVSAAQLAKSAWAAIVNGVWVNPIDPYRSIAIRAIDLAESRSRK
jgi:hypothetical protein